MVETTKEFTIKDFKHVVVNALNAKQFHVLLNVAMTKNIS